MERVWIFHIFGDEIQFRECTKRLVREMNINKDGNLTVPVDGKDKDLYHLLPSGSSGEWLDAINTSLVLTLLDRELTQGTTRDHHNNPEEILSTHRKFRIIHHLPSPRFEKLSKL